MFSLAIIGRPNVGKSTLFNRMAGKKLAIVDNTPGVTRDWREAIGNLYDRTLRIIDTAGLEERFDESIQGRMRKQTEAALDEADAILFVIDGREGVMPADEHFAQFIRKQKKPVILAVNKAESEKAVHTGMGEAYALGFGEPIAMSAEHNIGMEDLYDALTPYYPEEEEEEDRNEERNNDFENLDDIEGDEDFEFTQEEDDPEKPIKVAIVGRPNVGKSTLLNAILEEQRVMVGPEAGITRDAITVDWEHDGRKFKLVDTAGMRKRAKVHDNIEKMSVEDTLRAIRLAQVVILVLDGNAILEKQDLQIADHIINEGRALVVAVNKWDAVENREDAREELNRKFVYSLAQVKNIAFATISAINGKAIDKLLYKTVQAYEIWNKRVSTGNLNRWLSMMENRNPAPLINGRSNRLKYIAQIKTRPPTFAMWCSRADKLPESYKRFIINGLREDYDIPGVPIRLLIRKSKNPYSSSKS